MDFNLREALEENMAYSLKESFKRDYGLEFEIVVGLNDPNKCSTARDFGQLLGSGTLRMNQLFSGQKLKFVLTPLGDGS